LLFCLAPSNLLAALAGWEEAMVLRGQQVRRYYAITVITEIGAGLGRAAAAGRVGAVGAGAQVYARLADLHRGLPRGAAPAACRALPETTRAVLAWSWSRYGSVLVGFWPITVAISCSARCFRLPLRGSIAPATGW
jgi:hypothetical protein